MVTVTVLPPPEDVQGDIRSACGLAKLLIDERFDQFNDLIRQAEEYIESKEAPPPLQQSVNKDEIKVVLTSDLEGFWEMIEIQVKDVESKFEHLTKLKANNYVPLPIEIKTANTAAQSQADANAAKAKLLAFKQRVAANAKPKSNGNLLFVIFL